MMEREDGLVGVRNHLEARVEEAQMKARAEEVRIPLMAQHQMPQTRRT